MTTDNITPSDRGFDPDGVGIRNGNYFGMPFSPDRAALVLVSVPWDVTSSYGGGSSAAPSAIIDESTQLDFYDPAAPGEWRKGIATLPVDNKIAERNAALRKEARKIIDAQESGCFQPIAVRQSPSVESTPGLPQDASRTGCDRTRDEIFYRERFPDGNPEFLQKLEKINIASAELNDEIEAIAAGYLAKGQIVGLVGGDHSTPLGLIKAVARREGQIGILHLDAHCDLRPAYEGFEHSHASIMFNALRDVPGIERLVQVGVRDFSEAEHTYAQNHPGIVQFTSADLSEAQYIGETWAAQCDRIVAALPSKVYISFDIDYLSPDLCPGTGTPVPGGGGSSFDEAAYLIRKVVDSGRRIVGFDLCEVSPVTPFDANVGARILFRLCGQTLRGN